MRGIVIVPEGITALGTDAVVNAANDGLWQGSGVCGAIFAAAGADKLRAACQKIGGCRTGSAVITPAFDLDAEYIIHAVGPVWQGGSRGEPQLLYGAYYRALELAKEHGCRSIGFPLISAGIFGYPLERAWEKALQACRDFLEKNPDCDLLVKFGIPAEKNRLVGMEVMKAICPEYQM